MNRPPSPSFEDVLKAKKTIAPYLARTALVEYPMLSEVVGTRVWVKREDTHPTSAFKVRGGVNLLAHLAQGADPSSRPAGVATASTGNHGQSIAWAARLFGMRCVVVVPEGANPTKVAATRAFGAEVVFHGAHFDDARRRVEVMAKEQSLRYVHSANEPHLVAGVATHTLEILEDLPDADYVFVPLGGGSGAAGAALAAKTLRPSTKVIAVQSAQAPAAGTSWKQKSLLEAPIRTIAEGLQTGVAFDLPQRILWDLLDDCILVDDAEIDAAVIAYLEHAHILAEHAGAAPLAGALRMRSSLAGKKVALILSGANLTRAQLEATFERHQHQGRPASA